MSLVIKFIQNSLTEFRNVTWPTRHQALRLSAIVIVFLIISSLFIGVADYLLAFIIT